MTPSTTANIRILAGPSSATLRDLAVALAALVSSLALLAIGGMAAHRPGLTSLDLIGVVLAAASTLPLVAWRRSPLGVLTVTTAAGVGLVGLGYPLDLMLGPSVALYQLAAARGDPWTWRSTAAVLGLFGAYLASAAAAQVTFPGTEMLHTGLAWAVAWFAGERTRLRREQIGALQERAMRAERDVERERVLAAAEERARIARDLHDSAGHAMNVIAIRAGAARMRRGLDPDRSMRAFEAIEEIARHAAEEIDQMVGRLREGTSPSEMVEAPHGLASVEALMAQHRSTGLDVSIETSGAPRPLAAAADQAAYRILQEALTNAARHGLGSAQIGLVFDGEWLDVIVRNPVPAEDAPSTARGHGLIGMRERAVLLGGTLDAKRHDGAFRVRARIPIGWDPA